MSASLLCCAGRWASDRPFAEQRAGHVNHFPLPSFGGPPPEAPPEGTYTLVHYAYVSEPRDGGRHPAVVYVHGGFDWSIDSSAWSLASRDNDQSGMAFAQDGLVVMFESFRGNHDDPGSAECFFGEIDDLVAASEFLAARPDVDPDRIYLVGHSTGATLALLTAEATDRFRAVFAIGPVTSVVDYGSDACLPATASFSERWLRDASNFVVDVRSPTFLIEGRRPRWASAPPQEWPQLVLTSSMRFAGRRPSGGASAFIIEAERRYVATAAHLTALAGGIDPPIDGFALRDPRDRARGARRVRRLAPAPDRWRDGHAAVHAAARRGAPTRGGTSSACSA